MLQPLQLQAVSERYPNEIAELRDFLLKAGSVPATEHSLPAIVHRFQHDRAFHRDLTSHLWVVIHLADRTISYADLMGVLAIATAGPRFAAQAHEDDAHALLRFVMEARRALDQGTAQDADHGAFPGIVQSLALVPPRQDPPAYPSAFNAPAPSPGPLPQPTQSPLPREGESGAWQTRSSPDRLSYLDPEPENSRRSFFWIAAACLFIALCIGLAFHFRIALHQLVSSLREPTPTPAVTSEAVPPTAPSVIVPPAVPEIAAPRTKPKHHTPSHEKPTRKHLPAKSPTPPPPTVAATSPRPAPAPITRPATTQPSTPRPTPPVTATTPAKSSEPDRTNIARTYDPPRLVRRTPEQRAELNPGALNNIVHATTLGSGASSVLYSPVPAYPTAAADAHVQGEVKVQANVNPQGNVDSVRVISGPPLLREAALEAAQRWRYRPNMEDGEPNSMRVTTVFDFKLP